MKKTTLFGLVLIAVGIVMIISGILLGVPFIVFGILFQLKGRGKIERLFYQVPSNLTNETKTLRLCIGSYWIIILLAMVVSSIEEGYLPPEIIRFSDAQLELAPNWIIGSVAAFFIINIIGSVGVFFLQSWGKITYISSLLGLLVLTPFFGAMVVTPFFGLFDEILSGLTGIIIYLLYLSTAKEHFQR